MKPIEELIKALKEIKEAILGEDKNSNSAFDILNCSVGKPVACIAYRSSDYSSDSGLPSYFVSFDEFNNFIAERLDPNYSGDVLGDGLFLYDSQQNLEESNVYSFNASYGQLSLYFTNSSNGPYENVPIEINGKTYYIIRYTYDG